MAYSIETYKESQGSIPRMMTAVQSDRMQPIPKALVGMTSKDFKEFTELPKWPS